MTGEPLDPALLEVLACPACKGPLAVSAAPSAPELVCSACSLAYPVQDGIPVLLVDSARPTGTTGGAPAPG